MATQAGTITASDAVPLNFGVILFPGFQALDVFGPLDALNTLASTSPYPLNLSIIASTLDPVSTKPPSSLISASKALAFGESVVPTHTFDTAPPLDVLLVPGGRAVRDLASTDIQNAIKFIESVYPKLKYLITVCTGSVIAAHAGVLDGKRATTNKHAWGWATTSTSQRKVRWVPHARWVVDGNVWTSSGVSAGLDLTFAWIGEVFGEETANELAEVLEYERHADPSWDPYAELYGLKSVEA
ncbi:hypothetical protein C0995_001147 [Termitomyces sp. Mi166|nr:hypothetical protein C0995_001147 [Termitomyces sp. Mi166\